MTLDLDKPRYFVEHGTIHDRVTGQHVELVETADLLSVEPEAVQRVAWGVVVGLGAQLKNAESQRDSAIAERDRLRELLEWLDRGGGLGIEVHERIRAVLAGHARPPKSVHPSHLTTVVDVLETERDRLRAEVDALRSSLLHACELRAVSHENERQLWAMRQTANKTSAPFTYDAVQNAYNEYPSRAEEMDRLRAENQRLAAVWEAAKAWRAAEAAPVESEPFTSDLLHCIDVLKDAIDAKLAAEGKP